MAARRFKTAFIAGVALTVSGLSAHACKEPTQVTLDLRATNDCSALRGVHIGVAGNPVEAEGRIGAFLTAEAPKCAAGSREIGTLVVTPGESSRAAIIVVAGVSGEARDCTRPEYKGCVVARRSLSFVDSKPLVVPILIDFACKDVPCDVDTTCKNGECIDARLDCNEDGCVSKDPRGRDEDGGENTRPDGAANDGARDGAEDVVVPPNDGSPKDATNDTTFNAICPHKCPPQLATCAQGTACCYNQIAPPHCAVPDKCENPPASMPPGLAVCCTNTLECGSACCVKYQDKNPFRGVATCRAGSFCPAGEQQLCDTAADCPAMAECGDCGNYGFEQVANLKCCAP